MSGIIPGPGHLLRCALALLVCFWLAPVEAQEADAAVERITDRLGADYYEIEFFVFERSDVMEFNSREILLKSDPLPYPTALAAFRGSTEPFGAAYRIDAYTRSCLVYPTLAYSISESDADFEDEAAAPESGDVGTQQAPDPDPAVAEPAPAITPEIVIDPLAELTAAVAQFEQELEERSNRWADPSSFTLDRAANQVARRGIGRILFHGRWLQAVPPRQSPVPILIRGGEEYHGQRELNGSVDVTLGRYLHFRTRLNYAAPGLGARPVELASAADGSVTIVDATGTAPGGFMTMTESRRMRSEELHYLDHPKLGIVVRIDPVTIPQSLIDLSLALEESEQ